MVQKLGGVVCDYCRVLAPDYYTISFGQWCSLNCYYESLKPVVKKIIKKTKK